MSPENAWLEDEFPFGKAYFQVHLPLVSGSVNDSFAAPGPGRSAETAEQLLDQKPSCVRNSERFTSGFHEGWFLGPN